MRVGLVAVAEHVRDLESRAARAEAFDDEFRDTLCAAIFLGDAEALGWLQGIAEAHREAWEAKNNFSKNSHLLTSSDSRT